MVRLFHRSGDLAEKQLIGHRPTMSKGRQSIAAAIRAYRYAEARGDLATMAKIRKEYRI